MLITDQDIAVQTIPADQALPVGTMLCDDQFTITDHLGAGGFGITYRASDNVLGRTIVIKECFPTDLCVRHGRDVAVRSRAHVEQMGSIIRNFMREARSLAKLRHPNVVGVHRAFEENSTAYMALDLIDGRDLADILQREPQLLSPARIVDILAQLLDAIEKVHDVDLLHRDISPDNILIEKSGTPVLIDFGAARGDASRQTRAVSALLVVKDGYSPHELYVAGSEQAPNSDLYALAATFYHVISGEAPVNSQSRMVEVAGNKPDPCTPLAGRFPGYPPEFLEAIDTAMNIHPSKRLQSAARWRSLIADRTISSASPVAGPRPSGKDISLDLERSLIRLVEETNDEVRRTSEIPPEPAHVEPVATTSRETSRPDWVEEFNRESLSRPNETAVAPAAPESAVCGPVVPGRPLRRAASESNAPARTNWIGRAKDKQERVRLEQARLAGIIEDGDGEQAPRPDEGAAVTIEQAPQEPPARPSAYRPLGILFLLVCFVFVMLIETP
ncbi:MAG: protein kinase [Silicimonas sp.]|nr:protein kinase [Silicimonas sp.]